MGWFARLRADRQQLRELLIKLEALVDPTFLDRALNNKLDGELQ